MGDKAMELNTEDIFNLGESLKVEFKDDSRDGFNMDNVIRACVGMANAGGGTVYCGVDDKGQITGSKKSLEKGIEGLEGFIRENTEPGLETSVSCIAIGNKQVMRIVIPFVGTVTSTKGGAFYKRVYDGKGQPCNRAMRADEIIRTSIELTQSDYSALAVPGFTLSDIDLDLVKATAHSILEHDKDPATVALFSQSPEDILTALNLVSDSKITRAAVLLFGKSASLARAIPSHRVQFQIFSDTAEILANELYTDPIASLLPKLLQLRELNRASSEIIISAQSFTLPEYNNDALRELFTNALAHRDYTLTGSVLIQLYPDSLTVSSPGGFLNGIRIDQLLTAAPRSRNPLLSTALMRLKFVESSGRGIDKIFYYQALYGRSAPDYWNSGDNYVVVSIEGGKANLDLFSKVQQLDNPSLTEMLIINALYFKEATTEKGLSAVIQNSPKVCARILKGMVSKGWVYALSDGTYRLQEIMLNKDDLPSPSSDMETLKEGILRLLSSKEAHNVPQLSQRLKLSKSKTYRLIDRLRKEGKVKLKGKEWKIAQ